LSIPAMCEAFERAARLSPEHLAAMKLAARNSAQSFDGALFANAYREMIFGSFGEMRDEPEAMVARYLS
jgi:hypothetical protein